LGWLLTPTTQICAAGLVMVFGAWLIAAWMVGVVLMLFGLGLGVDALLRDSGTGQRGLKSHTDVLNWYRQAR